MLLTDGLRAEYESLWNRMHIWSDHLVRADAIVTVLASNRVRYQEVAHVTGVPWYVIAVIHELEGSGNFRTHLHNGDSLSARTVHVPAGRPLTGQPPFTWEESARDALQIEGFDRWLNWSLSGILFELERYNGWGYRSHHPKVLSPYLWSFSQHYSQGRYIADGQWSDSSVSGQCGAAVLLRRMIDRGIITIQRGVSNVSQVPGPDPEHAEGPAVQPGLPGPGTDGPGSVPVIRDPVVPPAGPGLGVPGGSPAGPRSAPGPVGGGDREPVGDADHGGGRSAQVRTAAPAPPLGAGEQVSTPDLNQFAAAVDAAALQLPAAATGRQNDRGARLVPAGVLIVPLFTDPGVPGAIYSADLVELKAGRLGVHRVETIRDGQVGDKTSVPAPGPDLGQLLSGHLLPGVLSSVLAGGDPLSLIAGLVKR